MSGNELPCVAADAIDVLRGLDEESAARPACEVLGAVAWDGPVLDPDTTPAAEFLAWL
jgi:hypothetical protein